MANSRRSADFLIGSVNIANPEDIVVGDITIDDVTVSASALPTGAATAAKQPALGTAGSASADVLTVQGVASMKELLVQLIAGTAAIGKLAANSGVDIGDVDVTSVAPASATSGLVVNVTTAGTRVQLTAGACQHGFWLTARRGNTGSVFIGGSDVSSSVYGADLLQGERVWLPLSNTNLIYIDSANNGDGVSVERC